MSLKDTDRSGQGDGYIVFDYFWRVIYALENAINNLPSGGGVTRAKFTNSFTNAAIVNKTPDIDFAVYSDGGSGGLLNFDFGGYDYDATTGTVTTDSSNYRIEY